jgi:hypothetical protein
MNSRSTHPEGTTATEPGVLQRSYHREGDRGLADRSTIAAQASNRAHKLASGRTASADTRIGPVWH